MKVKIKSFNRKLPSYLTEGKVYEVFDYDYENDFGYLFDDKGDEITFVQHRSQHLNGGSWEIVKW